MTEQQELRLRELVAQMTIEEKIGQLNHAGVSLVGDFETSMEELINLVYDGKITKDELMQLIHSKAKVDHRENDVRAGRIGLFGSTNDIETFLRIQKVAVEESRLGIPLIFGYDVIHGHRTVTPIPLAESCAWDPDLWRRTARMAADEATACGIQMTFAPMVDISRDARWGRIAESAGEDTLLNACYGAAKVQGFQGEDLSQPDSLAACVKHFAGYSMAEAGRDYDRVDVSRQRLYEEILPSYKACIEAGARAVMPAFNDLSGVPCSVNRWLLTDVLRREWGFNGLTISDANAIAECVTHGIAADRADAARQALEAGMDVDLSSNCYHENLPALAESGRLDMAALDRAVEDVLRVKFELGLFDDPYQTSAERMKNTLLNPQKRALAREAAQKSIVLLKNDADLLPLQADTRIGIAGKLANTREDMAGTWAIAANGEDCISLVDACKAQGAPFTFLEDTGQAGNTDCDVWIAAVGETRFESGEAASRTKIELHTADIELLDTLLRTGKPVIAVIFNGRPLGLGWLKEHVPAIVEAWHPGVEAGNALLDILFGKVVPTAKLTTTFPHNAGQCPIYYDHINTGRPAGRSKFTSKYLDAPIEPVYPFGYGLSYTTFAYSDLQVSQAMDGIKVTVNVHNTGKRPGEEIVQCYYRDPVARRVRPVKRLVDFTRIPLGADELKTVEFHIPLEKLGYYDDQMQFTIDDGEIKILVGGCSEGCLKSSLLIERGAKVNQ